MANRIDLSVLLLVPINIFVQKSIKSIRGLRFSVETKASKLLILGFSNGGRKT